MEGKFQHKNREQDIFRFWQENNLFIPQDQDIDKPTYSILMPPPNVTNILHLGHALNSTLQDVMIRYHRMNGYSAMWKIGVDHAGIATQNMVEKDLAMSGLSKTEIGREEFIKKVWDWKSKYGSHILDQLKRLGVSGDWDNDRFTMDEISSKAVKEIFIKLYNDKLIYRGQYIINWCVHCLTTISDDEVEHEEHNGYLYQVKYTTETNETLIVATTRPETILGDVALAVNPVDKRYQSLIGKKVKVPLSGRWIPIIADDSVEQDFGTGVLKVTPSHDVTDFAIGQKHHLPFLEVIDQYGKMTQEAGDSEGVDRFEFRKQFVNQLTQSGFIEVIEPYKNSRGTCYRCHHVIEPRVSVQWFVKMKELAIPAIEALKTQQVQFYPEKWEKVYYHWMDNIKDWSISRQLWWGHSIPAFHCDSCGYIHVQIEKPSECKNCNKTEITVDPDVLDTWFSSWIWPFTVFGASDYTKDNWQTEEFKKYYPTQYLATAPEIIFFWVARMIMAGMYLTGKSPFQKVFFNSTICDIQGRKMSKSLGNGIDPMEIIDVHGADAMRFTFLFVSPKGERIRMDKKSFDIGSRLVNKLWNASRFIFSKKPENIQQLRSNYILSPKTSWDFWILEKYQDAIHTAKKNIISFDYYSLSHKLYSFFWDDFCDWYLESKKYALSSSDKEEQEQAYLFIETLLDGILRSFHPIMPFVTEDIWQQFQFAVQEKSLIRMPYDLNITISINEILARQTKDMQKVIVDLRSVKKDFRLSDKEELCIYLENSHKTFDVEEYSTSLKYFANIQVEKEKHTNKTYVLYPQEGYNIYIALPKHINLGEEKIRLANAINIMESEIKRAQGKLSNVEFINNAEIELVNKEKQKIQDFQNKKNQLESFIKSIG